MKKQIIVKIIGSAIIFSFAMFFLQTILPSHASAAALNWDNPNKSGNNPYQFKTADVLNSQTMMRVVGCTGIVDKVSGAITSLAKKQANKILNKALESIAARKACLAVKKSLLWTSALVLNTQSATAVSDTIDCQKLQMTSDTELLDLADKTLDESTAAKKREECFNGIATQLAKNQLTAMTRYTMNWVNSGFNGDPMYVRNITSLTDSIAKTALDSGLNILNDNTIASPYASDFSRSFIGNYRNGNALGNGANRFLSSLSSSLTNFIIDPNSYVTTNSTTGVSNQGTYGVNTTKTALEQAKEANDRFANDFSWGGWNGYLGASQIDKNNSLGYSMIASQALDDMKNKEIQNTKDEVAQNNGFLSQKKCSLYNDADKVALEKTLAIDQRIADEDCMDYGEGSDECFSADGIVSQDQHKIDSFLRTCVTYDVITPGSIIKDQLSTYVNSPIRQLELADTINGSLNSVFSNLIAKLQDQGLPSLSSGTYEYTSTGMGGGPGSDNIDLFSGTTSGNGYTNGSFDLTHDLGNTFIHGYTKKSLGFWNAKTNTPKLAPGVAPIDDYGNKTPANVFYIVSVPGNTKLINDGYNGWAKNDRAFWNGSEWQNWKEDTKVPTNPIAKRGIIQIQKDYVVAAKEILMNLPNIMPKMGELDYCIPGPNPNWQNNATETEATFFELSSSLSASSERGKLLRLRHSRTYFSMAMAGDEEYDNYRNIFKYTPKWWQDVTKTHNWIEFIRLGSLGTIKNNKNQAAGTQQVEDLQSKISNDAKVFYDAFGNYINNLYGPKSPMQTQFIETEDKILDPTTDASPAWLPMSSEGLDITKNITAYNDDIITTADEYKDAIIKANSNISQLTLIKNEVVKIIQEAQKLRNTDLIKILGDEAIASKGPVLTEEQYLNKYKTCLSEEQIIYYDDMSIMGYIGGDAELRCSDGLDNDLDGLIDDLDPDCKKIVPYVEPSYVCILDTTEEGALSEDHTGDDPIPDDNAYCTERSAGDCTTSLYYNNGLGSKCRLLGDVVVQGNFSSTTSPIFGIATQDIDKGSMGQLIMNGTLSGVDTNNWATGTKLYLSNTTAGAMTNIPPNISSEGPIGSVANPGEINVGSANNYYDVNSFLQIEAGEDLKKGDLLVVSSSGSVSQLIVVKALGKQ